MGKRRPNASLSPPPLRNPFCLDLLRSHLGIGARLSYFKILAEGSSA